LRNKLVLLTVFALLCLCTAVQALPPNHLKTLQRAKQYAAGGDSQQALSLLQPILEQYPGDLQLLQTIYNIYSDMKDFENALKYLGQIRKVSPQYGEVHINFGEVYLKQGLMDSAAAAFERYLKFRQYNPNNYRRVSQAYLKNGFYQNAVDNYLAGRVQMDDSTQFTLELGQLYQRTRDYYNAAREFYLYMVTDTMNYRTGSAQMKYLISNTDDYEPIYKAFQEIVSQNPDNYLAYLNFAEINVKQSLLDSAFVYYQIVDQYAPTAGRYMLDFSKACLELEEYEKVSQACRYILANSTVENYKHLAKLNLAHAFISSDQADSAILIYHDILGSSRQLNSRQEGAFLLGSIFLNELFQTDSARHYFNLLLKDDPTGLWRNRAMIKIADSYMIDGELDVADSIYLIINTRNILQVEKEDLLYRRAQIKFFKKEYSDARGLYNLLTAVHPRSMFVNDCLRKILIIDENSGMAMIDLDYYATAERMIWQNKPDSALAKLVDLAGRGTSELSALATFQAGKIYYEQEDYPESFEYFNRILESFTSSFYSAESQKYVGDLYFYHFDDQEKAREAYRLILENYPNKLLYDYARRQLRLLENT